MKNIIETMRFWIRKAYNRIKNRKAYRYIGCVEAHYNAIVGVGKELRDLNEVTPIKVSECTSAPGLYVDGMRIGDIKDVEPKMAHINPVFPIDHKSYYEKII